MIKLRATTNGDRFLAEQRRRAKNIDFAVVVALTRTAQRIKQAQTDLMRTKLDNPTRFTLNSLRIIPATKKDPIAVVETKTGFGSVPAGRYLSAQVDGGARRKKAHEIQLGGYTSPGEFADLDQHGNIKGSTYKKILSQLRLGRDATTNASSSRRSSAKRKKEAFFLRDNIVFLRKRETYKNVFTGGREREDEIRPYLVITRSPRYEERLPFFDEAQRVWQVTFPEELGRAFDQYTI